MSTRCPKTLDGDHDWYMGSCMHCQAAAPEGVDSGMIEGVDLATLPQAEKLELDQPVSVPDVDHVPDPVPDVEDDSGLSSRQDRDIPDTHSIHSTHSSTRIPSEGRKITLAPRKGAQQVLREMEEEERQRQLEAEELKHQELLYQQENEKIKTQMILADEADEKKIRTKVGKLELVRGPKSGNSTLELKVILIGDAGVGKTNLLSRFVSDEFAQHAKPTVAIEIGIKNIVMEDGQKIKVQFWDTAGQERYRAITRSYYKGARIVLLLYDCTSPETLDHLADWIEDLAEHGENDTEKYLIGNKYDLLDESPMPASEDEARRFALAHGLTLTFTSAKTGLNCQRLFHKIIEKYYEQVKIDELESPTSAPTTPTLAPTPEGPNQKCC